MGGEPPSSWSYGNKNGSIHSVVPSVCRATNRNNPQRVFGPVVVLDSNGFRNETDRFQRLLQRVSESCRPEGRNSDRSLRIQRCESPFISLAATLSWTVPNTDGGISTNSPCTAFTSSLSRQPESNPCASSVRG